MSPLNPTISAGSSQQFFATANYSDKSTKDVTQTATWNSSDATTASVESSGQTHPGLASGLASGTSTITVSFGGKSDSSSLTVAPNGDEIPLMDMTSTQNYLSFQGGLYENITNTVPTDHSAAGQAAAAAIQPLDANGNPSPSGKIVFVSVGRSEAVDEFTVFMSQAKANTSVNHTTLVIANGAIDSAMPCAWTAVSGPPPCASSLPNQYDRVRDTVLAPLGVTEKQVQVAWIEEYDAAPGDAGYQSLCDPTVSGCSNTTSHTEALYFEQQIGGVLRAAKTRWPNLKQVFHTSRIYGGYATTNHNTEPYAYEYGFGVKWLIEAQVLQMRNGGTKIDAVAGDLNYSTAVAPWTAWGPYTWADGDLPRSDGLVWCDGQTTSPCNGEVDFLLDGTHPNSNGDAKVSKLLLNFFLNSTFTPWFR